MTSETHISQTFLEIEGQLKNYLKRFLKRQQDIDDAVQETFARAYEAEKKNTINSPRSFMYQVAKNLALSELTKKTNQMIESIGDIEELNVINSKSSVSQNYEQDCFFSSLITVIEDLPPRCQKVLILRKGYGFSQKEIAQRLDISVKTVEKHLTKALKRCHELQPVNNAVFVNDVQENYSDESKHVA